MSNLVFLILKSSYSFIILSTKIKMIVVVSLIEITTVYDHRLQPNMILLYKFSNYE